jgi:membrane-bound inhibitor of C-type lysozyme
MITKTSSIAFVLLLAATSGASATEASYVCSGGTRLTAVFSPPGRSLGQVELSIAGSPDKIVVPQVMSADGGRYSNQDIEFWIKGREATLMRNGGSETCHSR